MKSEVVYYRRPDGTEPARDWVNSRDNSVRPNIYGKIEDLENEGLDLLGTNSLDIIEGEDNGLYELRNRSLGWRLAAYHDRRKDKFVLLCGWQKTKKYKSDIAKARTLLHEYLAQR